MSVGLDKANDRVRELAEVDREVKSPDAASTSGRSSMALMSLGWKPPT